MKNFKVKWDCREADCTDPVVSVVAYDRVSADQRAERLVDEGRSGVEVFEAPVGAEMEWSHVGHVIGSA